MLTKKKLKKTKIKQNKNNDIPKENKKFIFARTFPLL